MFRQLRAEIFYTTEGMIAESKTQESAGDDDVKISYRYVVDGRHYTSGRYRYGRFVAAGIHAESQQFADAHAAGGRVTVYFNPQDPAEALLYPGVSSRDYLFCLLLTPFNIAMLAAWAAPALALTRRAGISPGGLRISEHGAELRARPPGVRAISRAAIAAFGASIAATALVGIAEGWGAPSAMAVAAAWGATAGAAALAHTASEHRELVIDRMRQTLSLPSASLFTPRTTIRLCDIVAIRLHEQAIADSAGETRSEYACRVRWRNDAGRSVETAWPLQTDNKDAVQLVAWLEWQCGKRS